MIVFKSLVFLFLTGLCLTRLKDKLISLLCLEVEESVGFRYSNAGQCYKLGKKCFFFFFPKQICLSFIGFHSLHLGLGVRCLPLHTLLHYIDNGVLHLTETCVRKLLKGTVSFLCFICLTANLLGVMSFQPFRYSCNIYWSGDSALLRECCYSEECSCWCYSVERRKLTVTLYGWPLL